MKKFSFFILLLFLTPFSFGAMKNTAAGDGIIIPSNSNMNISSGPITICMWENGNQNAFGPMIDKRVASSGVGYSFFQATAPSQSGNPGRELCFLQFCAPNGANKYGAHTTIDVFSSVAPAPPQLVCAVWNGTAVTFYNNGVVVTSSNDYNGGTLPCTSDSTGPVTIGWNGVATSFSGTYEDAMEWNYALSSAEINNVLTGIRGFTPYNTGAMIGWWKLNDMPPSDYGVYLGSVTIFDHSPLQNNGTTRGSGVQGAVGLLNYPGQSQ